MSALAQPSLKMSAPLVRVVKKPPSPLVRSTSIPYLLSVRIQHKFQKIRSFLLQKVRTSASEGPSSSALDKPH